MATGGCALLDAADGKILDSQTRLASEAVNGAMSAADKTTLDKALAPVWMIDTLDGGSVKGRDSKAHKTKNEGATMPQTVTEDCHESGDNFIVSKRVNDENALTPEQVIEIDVAAGHQILIVENEIRVAQARLADLRTRKARTTVWATEAAAKIAARPKPEPEPKLEPSEQPICKLRP